MRIQSAKERSEIDIDISEILEDGGKLSILPEVKNYFSIDYKPRSNKLTLAAKGYIGLIPITSNLAIDIRPKFSIKNLTTLVSIAQGKFKSISFFSRKYDETEDRPEIVYDFLVESFIHELGTLYTEGVYKEYVKKASISNTLRGRLDASSSIKSLWAHGKFNKVKTEYFELSQQTPLNQLIKYTILYCIKNAPKQGSDKNNLIESLIFYANCLSDVKIPNNNNFLEQSFLLIKSEKIPILRNYYISLCEICRLILTGTGIDFDNEGTFLNLSSFIICMDDIFEKFLFNTVKDSKNSLGINALVLDGNKEGKKKFFSPPGKATGDAKPDIIIKSGDSIKLIADAKYKPSTKDTDRYQVISHALSYNSTKAVLILPSRNQKTYIEHLGSVGDDFVVSVYEIYIDLSSDDLEEEQIKLMSLIKSIL